MATGTVATGSTRATVRGGYTNNGIDCHDSNAAINPGQPESCLDTIDNNCDGYIAPYCGGPTNPNPNPCNGDPLCHEP
ncbi:putative metal-binding motif-containing protein [Myxococcus faecalis]|uniref:putative metal-binding motif-containing protein n=1 Tax=Myxococcus faecalis TaxID=3115646 RepID=UPI003CEC3050